MTSARDKQMKEARDALQSLLTRQNSILPGPDPEHYERFIEAVVTLAKMPRRGHDD